MNSSVKRGVVATMVVGSSLLVGAGVSVADTWFPTGVSYSTANLNEVPVRSATPLREGPHLGDPIVGGTVGRVSTLAGPGGYVTALGDMLGNSTQWILVRDEVGSVGWIPSAVIGY